MRRKWINCLKMSGVNRDAPIGIQCLQKFSTWMCPRLRLNRLRCYLWQAMPNQSVVGAREYQASVLILTYFTYMTYHLTRKPISVVKSVLHQNCSGLTPPPDVRPGDDDWCDWAPFNTSDANSLLGTLDSAFLFSYAGAMFVSARIYGYTRIGSHYLLQFSAIQLCRAVFARFVLQATSKRSVALLSTCMIAERVDLRYFLSLGMLVSAIFCYLFGLGRTLNIHSFSFYLLIQAGAGIAQTTGWPGTVAVVGKWFGSAKKGLIFGLWNSHTSLGNILGTLMAAKYVESDWSLSFVYPALVMGVVGCAVFLFLAPEPRTVGLSADRASPSRQSNRSDDEEEPTQVLAGDQAASLRPSRHSANASQAREDATEATALLDGRAGAGGAGGAGAVSLRRALAIPGVVDYSLSLFFAKLVSYTFLYWLPSYIKSSTSLTPKQSGELSTAFDVGGVVGAVLAGLLADCGGCPALVCAAFYALCAPTLLVYQRWGAGSYALNVALLAAAGVLVNGPYALITTAVSADLGTHSSLAGDAKALATVTAIIDGTGSIGAALGPLLAGLLSGRAGRWACVFYVLVACDCMALLLLLRMATSEVRRMRRERRVASPRLVRVE